MFLCGYFVENAGIQNFWYATFFYPATYYAAAESNGPAVFYVDLTKALDVTNLQDGIAAAASLLFAIVLPATIPAALIVFARRRGESWESITSTHITYAHRNRPAPYHLRPQSNTSLSGESSVIDRVFMASAPVGRLSRNMSGLWCSRLPGF